MSVESGPDEKPFHLPECWEDDEEMDDLFATFRQRSLDPGHYNMKMRFWKKLIMDYCTHHSNPVFSRYQVQLFFERDRELADCLDTVVEEMIQLSLIRRHEEYEYDPLNSWSGWAVNSFVKRPMSWGLAKLQMTAGLADDYTLRGQVKYVHLAVIKQLCKQLQTLVLQPHKGELLHYDKFVELCKASKLYWSEDVFRLCLHTLRCQQKIGLELKQEDDDDDEETKPRIHLIKVPGKGNTSVLITESDHAVHNLQVTQVKLLEQLEVLEDDINGNETKARELVKAGKRQLAKTYLRKKQLLERSREKRATALLNIETLLNNVEEARSTGHIIDAYKIGSRALQAMLAGSGLNYDNVDEVLADVRESVDENRDVQQALGNPNLMDDDQGEDNEALERELEEILKEAAQTPATPSVAQGNNNNNNNNMENDNGKPTEEVSVSTPIKAAVTMKKIAPTTPILAGRIAVEARVATPLREARVATPQREGRVGTPNRPTVLLEDAHSTAELQSIPTSLVQARSPINAASAPVYPHKSHQRYTLYHTENANITPENAATFFSPQLENAANKWNNNNNSTVISPRKITTTTTISDDEDDDDLLEMLDNLEVEEGSIRSDSSGGNSSRRLRKGL